MRALLHLGLVVCIWASVAAAGDLASNPQAHWPEWRGPTGTGVAKAGDTPTEWSESKNIKWKVAIPGQGHSTPVIWGDRIFIASAIKTDKKGTPAATATPRPERRPGGEGRRGRPGEGRRGRFGRRGRRGGFGGSTPKNIHKFVILCLDRKTGMVLWQRTANEVLPHEGYHNRYGSHASSSPAVDGENVYAYFGSRGLFCYDMEGTLQWKKQLGRMSKPAQFGEGSSPILHDDALIIQFDHSGDSFLTAINKKTGETIWKTDREERASWSTPVVVEVNGKHQVVAAGTPNVRGYDLATGKEIWHAGRLTGNVIPTVVYGHGMVFAASGFRGNAALAIRLGGTGDLTDDPKAIAWKLNRATPYVPSPVLWGNELYFVQDNGMLSCYDAKTGSPHYTSKRLPGVQGGKCHASPVGAGDKLYVPHDSGACVVVKRGPSFEVLATNKLDEPLNASPAVAEGELFLRGDKHLYCISTN